MNTIDRVVFDVVGQLAGRAPRVDRLVAAWISDDGVLKGDLAMAFVWWSWFRRDDRTSTSTSTRRAIVLGTVVATAISVVLGRALGHLLPFRLRPYTDPTLHLHLPAVASVGSVRWSSLPSDHAMVWAAIAVGIGAVSVPAGIFLWVIGVVFVCLPRVYVGLHFATDILAGVAVGAIVSWVLTRTALRDRIAAPLLRWEAARPGTFYAAAFLVTLHLAGMFLGLRQLVGQLLHGE